MTYQVRDTLIHQGNKRPIRCLPLEHSGVTVPKDGSWSSGCWRGYQATWQIVDDALCLVDLKGPTDESYPIELSALFPDCGNSVVAAWFSGLVADDDSDTGRGDTGRGDILPFAIVVRHGKVLQEKFYAEGQDELQIRLTPHAAELVSQQEWAFLEQIQRSPYDPNTKLVYADWLEERGDPRAELLRDEVARQHENPSRIDLLPRARGFRQDIPGGYVDPADMLWFWRWLAEIPAVTPDDQRWLQHTRGLS